MFGLSAAAKQTLTDTCTMSPSLFTFYGFSDALYVSAAGRVHFREAFEFEGSQRYSIAPKTVCLRSKLEYWVLNTHRLYRRLLRAHRALPPEMRSLGDDYIKAG